MNLIEWWNEGRQQQWIEELKAKTLEGVEAGYLKDNQTLRLKFTPIAKTLPVLYVHFSLRADDREALGTTQE